MTASVLEAAEAMGLDVAALRDEAGIDPALLADPDARVPLPQHFKLWQLLSRRPIGLELGARLGLSGMGAVGYAMQHGTTVGQALDWLHRYRAVLHPDLLGRTERRPGEDGERLVFIKPPVPAFASLREPLEAQAAATVAVMQALTGTPVRALGVAFPLARPDDDRRHREFFGCPVTWASADLEVAFDAALLDRPLPRSDARLFGYLARRADELLASLPAEDRVADRARREIGILLAQGEPRLADVAKRLGLSERTLHRRLQEEQTTFAALIEESRRDRAVLLLEDPRLSASEIAFLVGYSEPAPFFRAFRRWTGASPAEFRRRSNRPTTTIATS